MRFLNKEHEKQLVTLLQRDGTHPKDTERLALLFYQVMQIYMQSQRVSMILRNTKLSRIAYMMVV